MEKSAERIQRVSTNISKALHEEIVYALNNLKDFEKKKTSGKKKERWTFLEASDKLAKLLKSQRKK